MSDKKAEFEAAVDKVQNAPADGPFQPSNELKLKMYGLYKQATEGDVKGKKPGMLDVVGRAKYKAWEDQKGKSSDQAMQAYIDQVNEIDKQHG